ncbi:MAG: nitroreductase family protein [Zoogloea sp.]|uniref:nitroreductase family protein n=1 Tax=Zoogloea sp. TaxID=49181 RepID=UPI003F3DDD4E|nr:nitroreductase family protein [Rhodocyclales bacterium]
MNVAQAIERRRSVKAFDPAHQMEEAEITQLLGLAKLSPTAFNIQNWRFVVLRDPALRAQVRAASFGQAQVTDASLLVVLTADLKAWEKAPQRYWRDAAQPVQDAMLPMLDGYYRGREQVQRDEAMRSCGIAAQTLMLAAQEMGYESCPMDGFDFDAVGKLINLPADHVISMFVAIGKPLQPAHPRSGPLALEELVVIDRF